MLITDDILTFVAIDVTPEPTSSSKLPSLTFTWLFVCVFVFVCVGTKIMKVKIVEKDKNHDICI